MTDGSSADLLKELNEKRHRARLLPFAAIGGAVVVVWSVAAAAPSWAVAAALLACVAGCWLAATRDTLRKTTVIVYDLEPDVAKAYEAVHAAFEDLRGCRRVGCRGQSGCARREVSCGRRQSNQAFCRVSDHRSALARKDEHRCSPVACWTPGSRIHARSPSRFGVVSGRRRVVPGLGPRSPRHTIHRGERCPSDATVIDKTWRYVNKEGWARPALQRQSRTAHLRVQSASILERLWPKRGLSRFSSGRRRISADGRCRDGAGVDRTPDQPSNPALEPTARS